MSSPHPTTDDEKRFVNVMRKLLSEWISKFNLFLVTKGRDKHRLFAEMRYIKNQIVTLLSEKLRAMGYGFRGIVNARTQRAMDDTVQFRTLETAINKILSNLTSRESQEDAIGTIVRNELNNFKKVFPRCPWSDTVIHLYSGTDPIHFLEVNNEKWSN